MLDHYIHARENKYNTLLKICVRKELLARSGLLVGFGRHNGGLDAERKKRGNARIYTVKKVGVATSVQKLGYHIECTTVFATG